MTARDMLDERERAKIPNPNDEQDGSRGRSPYPVAAGAAGACREQGRAVTPAGTTGAEPSASARLASGPAAREAAAQELATALREEPDRKKRLDTIDALIAIPGEEGSRALERYILENRNALTPTLSQREREEADREWELNRALRLLIERHGASQELGPFRWLLSAGSIGTLRPSAEDVPPTFGAPALRAIEAAAQTPSARGLAFLLAVRESFPPSHALRLRADAAIARRAAEQPR
jgi:hypothetical protein